MADSTNPYLQVPPQPQQPQQQQQQQQQQQWQGPVGLTPGGINGGWSTLTASQPGAGYIGGGFYDSLQSEQAAKDAEIQRLAEWNKRPDYEKVGYATLNDAGLWNVGAPMPEQLASLAAFDPTNPTSGRGQLQIRDGKAGYFDFSTPDNKWVNLGIDPLGNTPESMHLSNMMKREQEAARWKDEKGRWVNHAGELSSAPTQMGDYGQELQGAMSRFRLPTPDYSQPSGGGGELMKAGVGSSMVPPPQAQNPFAQPQAQAPGQQERSPYFQMGGQNFFSPGMAQPQAQPMQPQQPMMRTHEMPQQYNGGAYGQRPGDPGYQDYTAYQRNPVASQPRSGGSTVVNTDVLKNPVLTSDNYMRQFGFDPMQLIQNAPDANDTAAWAPIRDILTKAGYTGDLDALQKAAGAYAPQITDANKAGPEGWDAYRASILPSNSPAQNDYWVPGQPYGAELPRAQVDPQVQQEAARWLSGGGMGFNPADLGALMAPAADQAAQWQGTPEGDQTVWAGGTPPWIFDESGGNAGNEMMQPAVMPPPPGGYPAWDEAGNQVGGMMPGELESQLQAAMGSGNMGLLQQIMGPYAEQMQQRDARQQLAQMLSAQY